jgi:multiple sugar transport system substrate-binding protein
MRNVLITAISALTLVVTAACSSDTASPGASSTTAGSSSSAGSSTRSTGGSASSTTVAPGASLSLLFGSSGTAETTALTAAAKTWAGENGATVEVTPAQDLAQQLAQGFSSGTAPDLFYVGADQLANYAKAGNLLPYADQLPNAGNFYPALKTAFTYDGKFYCAPKDMSTLALFINTDLWTAAGLTDADIPTNWDQLASVAAKLNTGGVAGLAVSPERDRVDSFLVQNGGYLTAADGTTVTASDQKNIDALTYVKKLMTDGVLKIPAELSAGWAGEAFGKAKAAMTIEGNWLLGAMATDYPTVKYKAVELPAGPTGTKGTLVFTNCWGISATTKYPDQAKSFVEYLTGSDQQLAFAKAFGVIPSVQSAQADYLSQFPANKPFVDGIQYARGVVNLPGITDVLGDYNSQLQSLATSDPKTILDSVQQNLTAAVGG